MTENTDIDALIAEARKVVELAGLRQSTVLIDRLADALEATAAELQNVSDIGDGDVQRLAESYSENLRLEAELRKERRMRRMDTDHIGYLEAELRKERERADEATVLSHQFRNERDKARGAIKRALDVQMFRVGTVSYGEEYMKKVHSVLREGLARNRN